MMTAEEELARQYGPVLSIARHIYDTQQLPRVGQKWKVDVHVVDTKDEPRRKPVFHEFSFEVNVTPAMLAWAVAAARHVSTSTGPKAWLTQLNHLTVALKDDGPASRAFITDESDLGYLVDNLKDIYGDASSAPTQRWLLDYLSIYWNPHVPHGESKDFYRGFSHGMRLSMDGYQFILGSYPLTTEIILLGVIPRALAGVSAELYFGVKGKESVFGKHQSRVELPEVLLDRRIEFFHITLEEAARWAASADKDPITKSLLSGIGEPANPGGPPQYFLIESGDTGDFYRGAAHGLELSRRILSLFHQKIFGDDLPMLTNIEEGLDRMRNIAAQYWLKTRRPLPN